MLTRPLALSPTHAPHGRPAPSFSHPNTSVASISFGSRAHARTHRRPHASSLTESSTLARGQTQSHLSLSRTNPQPPTRRLFVESTVPRDVSQLFARIAAPPPTFATQPPSPLPPPARPTSAESLAALTAVTAVPAASAAATVAEEERKGCVRRAVASAAGVFGSGGGGGGADLCSILGEGDYMEQLVVDVEPGCACVLVCL